jgi:hypothetical protein
MREEMNRHTGVICLVLSILLSLLHGCATVNLRPEILEAKKVRDQFFQENIDSYKPKTPDEGELLKKIVENYKRAYETFDLELTKKILSPDFQLRYYFVNDKVQIQDREEFIQKKSKWSVKSDPDRKLLISIKASHYDEKRKRYAFTALTTYQSRYFKPRFLEVLIFEKKEEWRLQRILMYPICPPSPELYEVKIFLGRYLTQKKTVRGLENEIAAEGPDVPFDKYLGLSKIAPASERGTQGPLVIIFSEPPPEGAKIEVYEQQREGFGYQMLPYTLPTYQSSVVVQRNGNPYFYILGFGWWGYSYSINIQVKMNGVKVAEEILRVGSKETP